MILRHLSICSLYTIFLRCIRILKYRSHLLFGIMSITFIAGKKVSKFGSLPKLGRLTVYCRISVFSDLRYQTVPDFFFKFFFRCRFIVFGYPVPYLTDFVLFVQTSTRDRSFAWVPTNSSPQRTIAGTLDAQLPFSFNECWLQDLKPV